MKTKVLINHNNFYPKYGIQYASRYGYNIFSSNQHVYFGEDSKNNLGNMHNMIILDD